MACVYVLFDALGHPFYVGITSNRKYLSRPTDHTRSAKKGAVGFRYDIIREMLQSGLEIPYVLVKNDISLQEAKVIEIALVAAMGRYPEGVLTNINRGGNSPHDFAPWQGKQRSEDTKQKIRTSLTGRKRAPRTPDQIARLTASLKGRKMPPMTQVHKVKLSCTTKASWRRGDKRAGMRGKRHSEQTLEQMRQSGLARVDNALREHGKKIGLAQRNTKWIYLGDKEAKLMKDAPLPEGWKWGRKSR